MCLARGPQRSDASEAWTHGLDLSTLPLGHCVPYKVGMQQEAQGKI